MKKRKEYLNLSKKSLGDKYIFEDNPEPLGEGGSGIVYIVNQVFGKDENIISKRAVKFFIFRDDLIERLGVVSINNFKTEIRNITQFNHQNILKVIDGDFYSISIEGNTYDIPYTITEYVEGLNLEDIFSNGNERYGQKYLNNEETIFDIFLEILDAVKYLHGKKFYHCDIAPKNIFLKIDENKNIFAILGDLGAGNTYQENLKTNIRVIGTKEYMSDAARTLKDQEISSDQFFALQPEWDIYSVVHTFEYIISQIREKSFIQQGIWNLERLDEKIKNHKYSSISELREDVEYLKPSHGLILNIDELSEASSNIRPCLIPCGIAMLSQRIKKLTKHDGMLRLMEVPQLLEGATTFPGANHTRYEHSLGTYELMRRALLALLRNKDYINSLSERNVVIALLAALLSSLTNFPYSYAIQELRVRNDLYYQLDRRTMFRELINKPSQLTGKSLFQCINEMFSRHDIEAEDIEYVIFGRQDDQPRKKELDYLYFLLNSSIGVRIIDYVTRDAHHIGISWEIETDNLFNNLAICDGEFCLKQGGISSAEQIITIRSWMFKRIYWSDPNRANAALLKYLFYIVYVDSHKIERDIKKDVLSFDCTKKTIQEKLLKNAVKSKKDQVQAIINFINHKGQQRYKSILVLDKNSEYSSANQTYSSLSAMNYGKQNGIREQLEKWFLDTYGLDLNEIDKGVVLLIDIPDEKMDNKTGGDIRVKRHDGKILELEKVSGIVEGMHKNYEEQLKLLRIYIRPDIYDYIMENHNKSDVAKKVNDKLSALL